MEPEIAPIEPMIQIQPWPLWVMIVGGIAALLVLAGLVYGGLLLWRRMKATAPLTPKETAFNALARLSADTDSVAPYAFSVSVSDILRTYVSAEYHLPATSQTSPEFLASVATHPSFSADDQELLKRFLEKADLIKFAHLQADTTDSEELLEQARRFVSGKGVEG